MNAPEHRIYGNLSFEERSSLKDLKSKLNLIIREADNGCSVVMDRPRFIEEGYRQLNDSSVCTRTHTTTFSDIEKTFSILQIISTSKELILMIFDSLPFVETISGLVSTCFQRYIEKVCQADQLFLRAVLP